MFHPQGPTFWELARQALSSTRRGYDLLAPKFDFTPFRTPDSILTSAAGLIGAPESVGSAIDICCGTGAAMRMLRPLCREHVVGVDFSNRMLAVGRDRTANAAGDARLEFVQADALDMPFRDTFDVAVCFGALGHIPPRDQPRFVNQVAGVLRPGGRFIFASARKPPIVSRRYWLSRGFNAAMHVRNFLVTPPFIMYYLTFLLPEATEMLTARGFTVNVHEGLLEQPFAHGCLVVATKENG